MKVRTIPIRKFGRSNILKYFVIVSSHHKLLDFKTTNFNEFGSTVCGGSFSLGADAKYPQKIDCLNLHRFTYLKRPISMNLAPPYVGAHSD